MPYIYAEERLYAPHWLIQTFRIILTLALYGNTIFRITYQIQDGDFWKSQLYFTTFSLYCTLYTETFIIITSFYTRKHGFDPRKRWLVNLQKHNNLFLSISLGAEAVTTVVYWFGIALLTGMGSRVISATIDHSLPFFILLGDLFMVGWVYRYTYFIVFITAAL